MNERIIEILSKLKEDPFFSNFTLRKRDYCLIDKTRKNEYMRIQFDYYSSYSPFVEGNPNYSDTYMIYPIYERRFEVLNRWLEKFSFKTLQDQRSNSTFFFDGASFGLQEEFELLRYDDATDPNYMYSMEEFKRLSEVVKTCTGIVSERYATLETAYATEIVPIFDKGKNFNLSGGADWIFIDLALARIVSPEDYWRLKPIFLEYIDRMMKAPNYNMRYFYPKLDEIFAYLESDEFDAYVAKYR